MHHDIRAMCKRILQPGRPKCRVDKQQRPPRVRLFRIVRDVIRRSKRINRGLQVDDIPFAEFLGGAVERENLNACESSVNGQDGVGTVVPAADGDFAGLEPGLRGWISHRTTRAQEGNSRKLQRWH